MDAPWLKFRLASGEVVKVVSHKRSFYHAQELMEEAYGETGTLVEVQPFEESSRLLNPWSPTLPFEVPLVDDIQGMVLSFSCPEVYFQTKRITAREPQARRKCSGMSWWEAKAYAKRFDRSGMDGKTTMVFAYLHKATTEPDFADKLLRAKDLTQVVNWHDIHYEQCYCSRCMAKPKSPQVLKQALELVRSNILYFQE